jgi:peptidase M1-like protein
MRDPFRMAAFVLALSSPASAAASSVAALAKSYDTLTAAGASAHVRGVRVESGHMVVMLADGWRVPVKAGDDVVGFFFTGKGFFEYRAADPIELPAVEFNVRKATSLKPEKGDKTLTLKDTFTDLLVVTTDPDTIAADAQGAPLDSAFKAHREWFGRIQEGPPSHPFILQRLDAPSAKVLRLEISGGQEAYVYLSDFIDGDGERLDVIRKTKNSLADEEVRKRLWRTTLSSQFARDRRDLQPPRFVVTDIVYTLRATNGRDATLSVSETIVPLGRPRSGFEFGLTNTHWDVTGTGYVRLRSERLRSVKAEDGTSLAFHHDRGALMVGLPAPAAANWPFKLTFEIEGDFLVRPQGDNFWVLEGNWLPLPQRTGRSFTMHATVRVKKPFLPFAPGVTKSRRVDGDENVLETEIADPVDFPVVLAGNYRYQEETREGMTVRVASYAMNRPTAFKKLTNLAFGVINYYEGFLGPFPFRELNIIEINDYGWGQAPPGTLFITHEAFNPILGEANQLFSGGVNHRFAHEIAHQYWGTVVKSPSPEEQWLEESFAEYCAALFIRDAKGKGEYEMLVARWKSRTGLANDVAPIALANRIEIPNDREKENEYRTGLLYGKGPYLLSLLHKEVGEETFLTFLKSYQKTFRWKFGTTKHVAGLLGFLTKKDYMPFFDANYWGIGLPR